MAEFRQANRISKKLVLTTAFQTIFQVPADARWLILQFWLYPDAQVGAPDSTIRITDANDLELDFINDAVSASQLRAQDEVQMQGFVLNGGEKMRAKRNAGTSRTDVYFIPYIDLNDE